jgi:uncharacterized protein YjiK
MTVKSCNSVRSPKRSFLLSDRVLTKDADNFQYKDHVAYVQVTGVDDQSKSDQVFQFPDVQLKIHAYALHQQTAAASTITFNASKDSQARVLKIPHECLAGVWERYGLPGYLTLLR